MFFQNETIMSTLRLLLDSAATWLFCCTMAAFVLPLILDRIVFYVPMMFRLSKTGEVQPKGLFISIFETILWAVILVGEYAYLYLFQHNLFEFTTVSPAAYISWAIGVMNLIYRFATFDRTIKRGFYYGAYMRHITPEALNAYQTFIEDLDDLYIDDLDMLLRKDLPYMHRQAVLRKKREASRT